VREAEAAEALGGNPVLVSLSASGLGQTWLKAGARRKVTITLAKAVEASGSVNPDAENTAAAEMAGMVHLGSALEPGTVTWLPPACPTAPAMVRNYPLARELLDDLYGRARRRVWELDSLLNRFGVRT
jgi:hypothetical protein